ncbi:MAG: TlpA family protein disulfide reductase [Gammaproteobacteria bacterium]|nr:TlpA family protein disulfide reductase [Gammaproteobacteria bacterium]
MHMATKKIIRPISLVFTVFALLLFTGVSASSSNQTLTHLELHPTAPEFTLQDIYGKTHALTDYQGKVVVVNFWATWCPPCVAEMPSMQRASSWLAKHDIPLLAVSVGESREQIQRFHMKTPVTFPLLLDSKSEVMGTWAALTLPTTYILDQQGRVIYLAIGGRDWDDPRILEWIRALKHEKHQHAKQK